LAKIPSRRVLPSGAVPTAQVPLDIANTGQGLEAAALGDIGQGVSRLGAVLGIIEERKQQATDLTQSASDKQGMQSAEDQIKIAEKKVPVKDRTNEYYEGQYNSLFTFDETAYGTKEGARLGQINFEARKDHFVRGKQIFNADVAIKDAIISTEQVFINEPTEQNKLAYEAALGFQHSEDRVTAELNIAQAKADKVTKARVIGVATDAAFGAWQQTVTPDNPKGDLNAAFDLIEQSDIPAEDKQEAESELKTRVTNRRAENKFQFEQQNQEDRQGIVDLFVKNQYAGIDAFINSTSLEPKEKSEWISKAATRTKAFNAGDADPFLQTDSSVYWELRQKIEIDPKSVTKAELAVPVGVGKDGGISIAKYEELLKLIEPDSPLRRPASTRAQASIARVRALDLRGVTDEELEGAVVTEEEYLRISSDLDAFILKEDPTDDQIDKKIKNLLRLPAERVTLNLFERIVTPGFAEESALQSKRFKAFKKHPAFDSLSDGDLEKVKEAFRLGATVDEVLENL
jgi:hypothetical protein